MHNSKLAYAKINCRLFLLRSCYLGWRISCVAGKSRIFFFSVPFGVFCDRCQSGGNLAMWASPTTDSEKWWSSAFVWNGYTHCSRPHLTQLRCIEYLTPSSVRGVKKFRVSQICRTFYFFVWWMVVKLWFVQMGLRNRNKGFRSRISSSPPILKKQQLHSGNPWWRFNNSIWRDQNLDSKEMLFCRRAVSSQILRLGNAELQAKLNNSYLNNEWGKCIISSGEWSLIINHPKGQMTFYSRSVGFSHGLWVISAQTMNT
jgi:hypothetical protein